MDVFELAKSVNIVEVIGGFISLQGPKQGHYLGLCPFHNDTKLGSFKVTPAKGLYKCFSCGMSGDSIDFVASFMNCGKYDAAVTICEMHGLITPEQASTLRSNHGAEVTPVKIVVEKKQNLILSPKRTPEELDMVYRAFMNAADHKLNEEFINILVNQRHLDESDLKRYFVWPQQRSDRFWREFRKNLKELSSVESPEKQDELLLGVPGFYRTNRGNIAFSSRKKACLGIPSWDRNGLLSGFQTRVMEPIEAGEARYTSMASGYADGSKGAHGNTLGCSCGYVEDIEYPHKSWCKALAITEGHFKTIALAKMGFLVVNMHGISNWRNAGDVALELSKKYDVSRFVLVYDCEDNIAVEKSKRSLATKLKSSSKLPVDIATWDQQYGKGVDDVVNNGFRSQIHRIPANFF